MQLLSTAIKAGLATAAVVFVMSKCGTGIAGASPPPDVSGKKYSDAVTALKTAGFNAEVGNTIGDQLAQGDCIVTGEAMDSLPSIGTKKYANSAKNVRLTLYCNALQASPGHSGMSAANPDAKRLQSANTQASHGG
jgi:hypothetical protein